MQRILHLLKIDLKKMLEYRTFWVVCGLYFGTMALTMSSGMEFLKWLVGLFGDAKQFDPNTVPLYHFPDVWQNMYFVAGFFKILIGILVVISITNEYSYRTIRQNIIDGMSRWEFLLSKILTNAVLSLVSAILVFLIALITGLIYTPTIEVKYVFTNFDFFGAYFLEVFSFLSFALMMGILIQRSGLTIIILLTARVIEFIIKLSIPNFFANARNFFPLESMTNLVPMPFGRYALQPIEDHVSLAALMIALLWVFLFNFFSYRKLQTSDI